MNNKEIKRLLNSAAQSAAPDILDSVLSACEQQKGRNLVMTNVPVSESPRKRRGIRGLAIGLAVLCLVLVGGIGGFFGYQNYYAVDSIVAFDVNPSIQLEVNKEEKVLSAEPLNADASKIMFDMDLKGTDLNVATNAIIGSMLRNGYLSDIANSILITVENGDDEKAAALQEQLVSEINQILGSNNIEGSILSQTLSTNNSDLQEKASTYNISIGKASLIEEILDTNSQYTFDQLAALSIQELNILAAAKEVTGVSSSGAVSTKGYISETDARDTALSDAGVQASSVTVQKLSLDWDDGRVVYDVEFYDREKTYEYEIDATSGEILTRKTEVSPLASGDVIGLEAAQNAAVSDAGVSSPTFTKGTLDRDDGRSIYEIEFISGNTKYEYDIDALSGSVLSRKMENVSTSTGGGVSGVIGEDAARQAALSDAGLSASDVTFGKVELDRDDGRWQYEIEFFTSSGKYEYDIDAQNGSILSKEVEASQTATTPPTSSKPSTTTSGGSSSNSSTSSSSSTSSTPPSTTSTPNTGSAQISEQAAKDAAARDAGLSASSVSFTKVQLEKDDGRWEYEIEFYANNTEYDYTVDASNGSILKRESEQKPSTAGGGTTTGGGTSTSGTSTISVDQAKALAQAKAPNATLVEISYDYDDGIPTYEGEMREGRTEYEFEIDARNGNFIKWESESD